MYAAISSIALFQTSQIASTTPLATKKKIKIKKDEQGDFGLFRPYYYWIIFNMPPLKKISGFEVLRFLRKT